MWGVEFGMMSDDEGISFWGRMSFWRGRKKKDYYGSNWVMFVGGVIVMVVSVVFGWKKFLEEGVEGKEIVGEYFRIEVVLLVLDGMVFL